MCAGGQDGELQTFERLLDIYDKGILSVVSDTWDLWKVLAYVLPQLRERILARNGKLVIRPDSGNPADILCGTKKPEIMTQDVNLPRTARYAGVVETLWNIFGGTVNEAGYKVLDAHVGSIYGDSINQARAEEITQRLAAKGFASTNVVFGCGSYQYQYVTRDTFGFAMKATWAQVNGEEHQLFKDPVTDDGTKRSARGRLAVTRGVEDQQLYLIDGRSLKNEQDFPVGDELRTVWQNGRFTNPTNLADIRKRLRQ